MKDPRVCSQRRRDISSSAVRTSGAYLQTNEMQYIVVVKNQMTRVQAPCDQPGCLDRAIHISFSLCLLKKLQFFSNCIYLTLISFLAALQWCVGSQFLKQEWNPCPLHWQCGFLTIGPPRKSGSIYIHFLLSVLGMIITTYRVAMKIDKLLQTKYLGLSQALHKHLIHISDFIFIKIFYQSILNLQHLTLFFFTRASHFSKIWEHLLEALRGEHEPICTLSGWVSQIKGTWHPILLSRVCVKNLPAMRETWVRSMGQDYPLEKGMATHSSILAWRIPWTKGSGRLQSIGLQRVEHN